MANLMKEFEDKCWLLPYMDKTQWLFYNRISLLYLLSAKESVKYRRQVINT